MQSTKKILSFSIFLMISLSFFLVLTSYFFNLTIIPLQELVMYLHAIVFMIGIVYSYKHDKHVRIDIFYQRFSLHNQNKVNFYGTILLLLPLFIFILFSSFHYVLSSWQKMETSAEVGGLPLIFILKSLILIMPLLMIISALFYIRRNKTWK